MGLSSNFPEQGFPIEVVLAAHMIINRVPTRAIEFLTKTYPLFTRENVVGCKEMAEGYACTPQGAAKHVRKLTACGYLHREHYRGWRLADSVLEIIERCNNVQ